jgi:hypothetical protein
MKLFRLPFLRVFIFLLLAVFVTNTVYAAGVMTSKPFENVKESIAVQHQDHTQDAAHCHDQDKSTNQNLNVHSSCNQCHHCFACFSAIPLASLSATTIKPPMVLAVLFAPIYLSPVTIQPQKPPIL